MKLLELFKSAPVLVKSERELIEEIHNEFDTAPDRLIQQANDILSRFDRVTEQERQKKMRLESIGFVNTLEVKEIRERDAKEREQVELANLVQHYKSSYPFLKFLTYSELDRICAKYTLIYAPVIQYQKLVPEKNLQEIERAQPINLDDLEESPLQQRYHVMGAMGMNQVRISSLMHNLKKAEAPEFSGKTEADLSRYFSQHYHHIQGAMAGGRSEFHSLGVEIKSPEYFIAAPKDHFDLTGFQLEGKFEYKRAPVVREDPIVFRKVKGGILVLTKWGLEASDPSLINPVNN